MRYKKTGCGAAGLDNDEYAFRMGIGGFAVDDYVFYMGPLGFRDESSVEGFIVAGEKGVFAYAEDARCREVLCAGEDDEGRLVGLVLREGKDEV